MTAYAQMIPPTKDWGNVPIGVDEPQHGNYVALYSRGDTLHVDHIYFKSMSWSDPDGQFHNPYGTTPGWDSMPMGMAVEYKYITFHPTMNGRFTATLTFECYTTWPTSEDHVDTVSTTFIGTGVGGTDGYGAFTPSPVNFGTVAVGSSREVPVTLRNTGGTYLSIKSRTINSPDGQFIDPYVGLGWINLAAGANVIYDHFQFSPTALGAATATITWEFYTTWPISEDHIQTVVLTLNGIGGDETLPLDPGEYPYEQPSDIVPVAPAGGITDLRAYTILGTDNYPLVLSRYSNNYIRLGDLNVGTNIIGMSGNPGWGACMLPFRPGASPNPWMYIASLEDYKKISAPHTVTSEILAYKVGIAEPQNTIAAEVAPNAPLYYNFLGVEGDWANAGNAGAISTTAPASDTVTAIYPDPALSTRYSVNIPDTYIGIIHVDDFLTFAGPVLAVVQDVIPPIPSTTIKAIVYDSGTTGRCTIVVDSVSIEPTYISGLRRGALVDLNGEVVVVLNAVSCTDGTVAFECITTINHVAAETVTGLSAIIVDGITDAVVGSPVEFLGGRLMCAFNPGVDDEPVECTVSRAFATSPFTTPFTGSTKSPTSDDLIHLLFDLDPERISNLKIIFNVGDTVDYETDIYSYDVVEEDLTTGLYYFAALTFSISSLTRKVANQARTLADCNGVMLKWNAVSIGNMLWGPFWIGGGFGPDVGEAGSDYMYRVVPRNSDSGAVGNASPSPRYGVRPRRQSVLINLPSAAYDAQIDTWDIYRFGGTVQSYRYIGSTLVTATTFLDNYTDDTANGGLALQTDNFEPWPSIGMPWTTNSSIATILVAGTRITVSGMTVWPIEIDRWLPGTLINIMGISAYTLRTRPTYDATTNTYTFDLIESAGYPTGSITIQVNEPIIARQVCPYIWGPDEQGTFFGCGDHLRPGVVYFSKSYNPDSAPDTYNLELSPPSEPLIGGELLGGISYVSSTKRWWGLYPSFESASRYTQIEKNVGRSLAAPYGHCTDGTTIYFFAKDGICATQGSGFVSLTDTTLYKLFPHEGVLGSDITRNGVTYYAPDYARAGSFRLSFHNKYLYADYQDTTGTPRTLVFDLREDVLGWSADVYADPITVHYGIEQPEGTLVTDPAQAYPILLLADAYGYIHRQVDLHNDGDVPISCVIGTFEWNGGDFRDNELWGDLYVETIPASSMYVYPISDGDTIPNTFPTVIDASPRRESSVISMSGGQLVAYLGLQLNWTDDFTLQSVPTTLYIWQGAKIPQVEITEDRFDDWGNCGTHGNKFFQGILLDADTFGQSKAISVRDSDTNALHDIQSSPINHPRRQTVAYSFATPFLAHTVRLEPQDSIPWRRFNIEYVYELSPESVRTWKTQRTAHGLKGFMTITRMEVAYESNSEVTLAFSVHDGIAPSTITLPSTAGVYQRILVTPTYNKFRLIAYSATSSANFRMFLNDWTIWVGEWGRQSQCTPYRSLGGEYGDRAEI